MTFKWFFASRPLNQNFIFVEAYYTEIAPHNMYLLKLIPICYEA